VTLAVPTAAAAALTIFAAIARERARTYGLRFSARHVSAVVPAAAALAISLWLAVHGDRSSGKGVMLACSAISAATDLQTGYVFDRIVFGSLFASVLLAGHTHAIVFAIAGAAVGGGFPLLAYAATAGRGIGLGDVKLAGAIGAGLGIAGTIEALRIAAVCAGGLALVLLICGRIHRRSAIRFAPFLALGASCGALTCD
jgi:prepilin signal peptidase PulO-like enzyme (type II secretory pathway)